MRTFEILQRIFYPCAQHGLFWPNQCGAITKDVSSGGTFQIKPRLNSDCSEIG